MQLLSDGVNGVMIDNTSGAISFIANGSKNVSCRVFNNRGSKTSNSVRVTVIDNTGAGVLIKHSYILYLSLYHFQFRAHLLHTLLDLTRFLPLSHLSHCQIMISLN